MINDNTKKKPIRKLRTQLILIMLGLIVAFFVIGEIAISGFLGKYYRNQRIMSLNQVYGIINELADRDEEFTAEINRIAAESNIQILVTDADFMMSRTNSVNAMDLAARLFGYYTGLFNEDMTILDQTNTRCLQISEDRFNHLNYLEMWGQLDNGEWFLIRTPMENMTEAVQITRLFYTAIGLVVLALSTVIVYFMGKRLTDPVMRLSELSRRMADQDFSARYEGNCRNEIGVLGENFNTMSAELEKAISELKSANLELQKDNAEKARIDDMRREFLNNVSHELKTPLALIQGYAEGLKDGIAEDPDSRDFYCDVIMDETEKMNRLVRQLLTLNRIEYGGEAVSMERFDLCALIRGVVERMKLPAEQGGITIFFDRKDPVWVWGDEFGIEEVVTNYLSNAINHADGEKRITISVGREHGRVKTTVFNTGKPIPEAELSRIWETFYKVDKARTRAYGGTGLGLSIVKAILERHGQSCGAQSFADGTAFWFTLDGGKHSVVE
ncbi:MAG: ATP-binding protein [Lachnospiraceae bacterium]|nr:ATP-binding protein [Lachnospiraceae bacterium]